MSKTSQGIDAGRMAFGGFGQAIDTMDLMKRAWSSFSAPTQFTPTLDVDELDKRIGDLRAVEQWLALNQSLLRNTIQGLEIQRGTLGAINAMSESFGKAMQPADDSTARTVARFAAEAAARQAAASAEQPPSPAAEPAPAADPASIAGINPLAWWELLQKNFQQIAEAATGGPASAPAPSAPATGTTAAAPAARPPARERPAAPGKAAKARRTAPATGMKSAVARKRSRSGEP